MCYNRFAAAGYSVVVSEYCSKPQENSEFSHFSEQNTRLF